MLVVNDYLIIRPKSMIKSVIEDALTLFYILKTKFIHAHIILIILLINHTFLRLFFHYLFFIVLRQLHLCVNLPEGFSNFDILCIYIIISNSKYLTDLTVLTTYPIYGILIIKQVRDLSYYRFNTNFSEFFSLPTVGVNIQLQIQEKLA